MKTNCTKITWWTSSFVTTYLYDFSVRLTTVVVISCYYSQLFVWLYEDSSVIFVFDWSTWVQYYTVYESQVMPLLNREHLCHMDTFFHCFFIFQSKLKRIPSYLAIQFVRFYYKEKEAINAKILKVSLDITINIDTRRHTFVWMLKTIIHDLTYVLSENIDLCSKMLFLKK